MPTEDRGSFGVAELDAFSRQLRHVDDYQTLVEVVRAEVAGRLGLTNAWLYVCERDDDSRILLMAAAGSRAEAIREIVPAIPRAGDALIEALLRDEGAVVIPDAQAGAFPEVTRLLQNRTVVNMPMSVVDHALGVLGCGTFGDEGVVSIDENAKAYLVHLANIASVALARLVLRKHDQERANLQHRLEQQQRIESLGLLAGGVAHDFNNLLSVMRMGADLVSDGPLTPTQQADLQLIRDASVNATKLTQKLLMLGRKQTLSIESTEINVAIEAFVALMQRLLPANISIDFTGSAGLPRLLLDPAQLEQVLMNLALNARDAMPNGGRLSIETEQVLVNGDYRRAHPWAKQGRYVLLTVSDTGVGMPQEVVDRVFEPFFTTKPPGEGTGLGLAVSWGIIQKHGGMIHCYSELGLGTSLKIYLPAAEQAAGSVGTKIVGPVPRGTESILVADDQPAVLHLLKRVLLGAGYRVETASDGAEAVEIATGKAFDLYLLDAVMPRMGGREACERIRSLWPEARFLFASGYGAEALPAEFLNDMGIQMVSKPPDPDALLRKVRAVLDSPPPKPSHAREKA